MLHRHTSTTPWKDPFSELQRYEIFYEQHHTFAQAAAFCKAAKMTLPISDFQNILDKVDDAECPTSDAWVGARGTIWADCNECDLCNKEDISLVNNTDMCYIISSDGITIKEHRCEQTTSKTICMKNNDVGASLMSYHADGFDADAGTCPTTTTSTTTTTTPTTTTTTAENTTTRDSSHDCNCPDGWVEGFIANSMCYQRTESFGDFYESREKCAGLHPDAHPIRFDLNELLLPEDEYNTIESEEYLSFKTSPTGVRCTYTDYKYIDEEFGVVDGRNYTFAQIIKESEGVGAAYDPTALEPCIYFLPGSTWKWQRKECEALSCNIICQMKAIGSDCNVGTTLAPTIPPEVIPNTPPPGSNLTECPLGFHGPSPTNLCYKQPEGVYSMENAQTVCQANSGASLISMHIIMNKTDSYEEVMAKIQAEYEYIHASILPDGVESYWIGYTRITPYAFWRDVYGTDCTGPDDLPFELDIQKKNDPYSCDTERCGTITCNDETGCTGGYNGEDACCEGLHHVICQLSYEKPDEEELYMNNLQTCGSTGWELLDKNDVEQPCYQLLEHVDMNGTVTTELNFKDATEQCDCLGGQQPYFITESEYLVFRENIFYSVNDTSIDSIWLDISISSQLILYRTSTSTELTCDRLDRDDVIACTTKFAGDLELTGFNDTVDARQCLYIERNQPSYEVSVGDCNAKRHTVCQVIRTAKKCALVPSDGSRNGHFRYFTEPAPTCAVEALTQVEFVCDHGHALLGIAVDDGTNETKTKIVSTCTGPNWSPDPDFTCTKVTDIPDQSTITEVINTIGCVFVISTMAGMIIFFLVICDCSNDRLFHMMEEICLLLAHILVTQGFSFDAGVLKPGNYDDYCVLYSMGMQFLFSAFFMFCLLESYSLFGILGNLVGTSKKNAIHSVVVVLVGLAVPGAITGITRVVMSDSDYMGLYTCWVNLDSSILTPTIFGSIFLLMWVACYFNEEAGRARCRRLPLMSKQRWNAAMVNQTGMWAKLAVNMVAMAAGAYAFHARTEDSIFGLFVVHIILIIVMVTVHFFGNAKVQKIFCCCRKKKDKDDDDLEPDDSEPESPESTRASSPVSRAQLESAASSFDGRPTIAEPMPVLPGSSYGGWDGD